jgi:hypothetical protein
MISIMKTNKTSFVLSRYPIQLTVEEVDSFLGRVEQNDEAAKKLIIALIEHRLNHRYIRPLQNIPKEFKSGFLTMATSCLLIETLQTFYEGKNESRDKNDDGSNKDIGSEKAFIKFFKHHEDLFPGLRACFPIKQEKTNNGKIKDTCTFYKAIRCGILHQAETTGGYRILRNESPLFDKDGRSINANAFLKATEGCVDKYVKALRESKPDAQIWKNAIRKVRFICANCTSTI